MPPALPAWTTLRVDHIPTLRRRLAHSGPPFGLTRSACQQPYRYRYECGNGQPGRALLPLHWSAGSRSPHAKACRGRSPRGSGGGTPLAEERDHARAGGQGGAATLGGPRPQGGGRQAPWGAQACRRTRRRGAYSPPFGGLVLSPLPLFGSGPKGHSRRVKKENPETRMDPHTYCSDPDH